MRTMLLAYTRQRQGSIWKVRGALRRKCKSIFKEAKIGLLLFFFQVVPCVAKFCMVRNVVNTVCNKLGNLWWCIFS